MNHDSKQKALGINNDTALPAIDLVAVHRSHEDRLLPSFYTLAVNDGSTGTVFSSGILMQLISQMIVQLLPYALHTLDAKIVIDRSPFGKIIRQHSPLAPGSDAIKDGI